MEYGQARGKIVKFEETSGHTGVPGCRYVNIYLFYILMLISASLISRL